MIKILREELFINSPHRQASFRPSKHALVFVYGGRIELESNGILSTYSARNIIIISPQSVYKLKHVTKNLKVYVLLIDTEALRTTLTFNFSLSEIYQLGNFEKKGLILTVEDKEFNRLIHLTQQLYDDLYSLKSQAFNDEIIKSLLSAIIYRTVGFIIETRNPVIHSHSRKEAITIDFLGLANIHFREEKGLKFYADALSISVKYLSICVKETTQTSASNFIAYKVINESKMLLLNTDTPIALIADTMGFSDQYSFGKFFKKHTSLSPRNYRKENHLISIA